MSSLDNSEDEENSQSQKENESEEYSEEEEQPDQNEEEEKSDREDSIKSESSSSSLKKEKFGDLKLVRTNEVNLNVISLNENKLFPVENEISINPPLLKKSVSSLKLLNEINNDLDQLFLSLSKNIKTFKSETKKTTNESDLKHENYIKNKRTQPKFSEKEINTSYIISRDDHNSKKNKRKNPSIEKSNYIYEYEGRPKNYNLFESDNYDSGLRSKTYIRTIEDLYGRKESQPIIYESNNENHNMHSKKRNKNAFEADSEFERRRDYGYATTGQNYKKPKDINQAMDILLSKDISD